MSLVDLTGNYGDEDGVVFYAPSSGGGGVSNNVTFDSFLSIFEGSGNLTRSYTPVGVAKAALVFVFQNGGASTAVTGATYGGVAMTPVGSPVNVGGFIWTYAFFLGSGIPTGAQTVFVAGNTSYKYGYVVTYTADSDTSIDVTGTLSGNPATNPSVTLATTAATETAVIGANFSGVDNATLITPGGAFTDVTERGLGSATFSIIRRTVNATGGDVVVDWVAAADIAVVRAIAIK